MRRAKLVLSVQLNALRSQILQIDRAINEGKTLKSVNKKMFTAINKYLSDAVASESLHEKLLSEAGVDLKSPLDLVIKKDNL